jgi:hypothetical protein
VTLSVRSCNGYSFFFLLFSSSIIVFLISILIFLWSLCYLIFLESTVQIVGAATASLSTDSETTAPTVLESADAGNGTS